MELAQAAADAHVVAEDQGRVIALTQVDAHAGAGILNVHETRAEESGWDSHPAFEGDAGARGKFMSESDGLQSGVRGGRRRGCGRLGLRLRNVGQGAIGLAGRGFADVPGSAAVGKATERAVVAGEGVPVEAVGDAPSARTR